MSKLWVYTAGIRGVLMRAFSRATGSFILLLALGYLVLLALGPRVPVDKPDDQIMTGRSVADQLSLEARSLMKGRKADKPTY